jgi:hypothetical protein
MYFQPAQGTSATGTVVVRGQGVEMMVFFSVLLEHDELLATQN